MNDYISEVSLFGVAVELHLEYHECNQTNLIFVVFADVNH